MKNIFTILLMVLWCWSQLARGTGHATTTSSDSKRAAVAEKAWIGTRQRDHNRSQSKDYWACGCLVPGLKFNASMTVCLRATHINLLQVEQQNKRQLEDQQRTVDKQKRLAQQTLTQLLHLSWIKSSSFRSIFQWSKLILQYEIGVQLFA